MRWLERIFEGFLWNSRLVVLVAVLASLAVAFAIFYMASVDAVTLVGHVLDYAHLETAAREEMLKKTIAHVVAIIDGYLLAMVLLIFSLGIYELFISRIDQADDSTASRILSIRNLDDLKNRLAKVILMILVVNFFEHSIDMTFDNPADILSFAGGIALIGLALYLSHAAEHGHGGKAHGTADKRRQVRDEAH